MSQKKFEAVEMNANQEVLDLISFLCQRDVAAMDKKTKFKDYEQEILIEDVEKAKRAFEKHNFMVKEKTKYWIKKNDELKNQLFSAMSSLDAFSYLSDGDTVKLERFSRILVSIEKTKQEILLDEGLNNLTDNQVIELSEKIIKKVKGVA